MATNQVIKLKRGTTTPSTSNLVDGEVAVDTAAQKFYINDSGTIKEIGAAAGGGIENVVEDTTPQLGGDLDLNSNDITGTGNITITGEVNATSIQLSGGTGDQGTLTWNSSDRTLDLKQNAVTLQLGQEIHLTVRNATGSTIGNGTFLGFSGVTDGSNRIEVSPFNVSTMEAHLLVGFATEDISNGVNGTVTNFGYVRELDTRGTSASNMAVGDEDWSVGDLLYPHPTVPGKLTTVAPATGLKAAVAVITNRHQSLGEIFVRVTALDENAYQSIELGDLADTQISSPSTNDIVYYDGSKFVNGSASEAQILTADDLANATNVEDNFTANGSLTTFTLSEAPTSEENILVAVDGVVQPVSAYSLSGTTLTISPALPNSTNIRVLHLKPLISQSIEPVVKYTLIETTPYTVNSASLILGHNIFGVSTGSNAIVNLPASLDDPRKLIIVNNEMTGFDVTINYLT